MIKTVNYPIALYKSIEGLYFVGYADNLTLGKGTSAWAALYNPPDSGVVLHVNVWTIQDISEAPFRAQIWFNATPPGNPIISKLVTPSNTAIYPLPRPRVKILQASAVRGSPAGGVKAFVRRGQPGITMVSEEDGKFIFPPGGMFLVFVSTSEMPEVEATGRVAFGWWEESIDGP